MKPRTSCTQGGGPGGRDSLSSLAILFGSLFQDSVPPWREAAGLGLGAGGSVYLVFSMCRHFMRYVS